MDVALSWKYIGVWAEDVYTPETLKGINQGFPVKEAMYYKKDEKIIQIAEVLLNILKSYEESKIMRVKDIFIWIRFTISFELQYL